MKQLVLFTTLFILSSAQAKEFIYCSQLDDESSEITWYDFETAVDLAKEDKKPIFIDIYTGWCGWCKKMDADTYSKPDIAKLINKNFIPVKFNPELKQSYEVNGQTMSGPELLSMLSGGQRIGYPTTFFLSTEKNKVQMVSGYKGPEDFAQILEQKIEWAKSK